MPESHLQQMTCANCGRVKKNRSGSFCGRPKCQAARRGRQRRLIAEFEAMRREGRI